MQQKLFKTMWGFKGDFESACIEAGFDGIKGEAQQQNGMTTTTMTPEFGPDGYLHTFPFTKAPLADLWEINRWMAETERRHFKSYNREKGAAV